MGNGGGNIPCIGILDSLFSNLDLTLLERREGRLQGYRLECVEQL